MSYNLNSNALIYTLLGVRESEINVAEGKKRAKILASEALQREQINMASGEANAIIAKAQARAEALALVAEAIGKRVRVFVASVCVECGSGILIPMRLLEMSSIQKEKVSKPALILNLGRLWV